MVYPPFVLGYKLTLVSKAINLFRIFELYEMHHFETVSEFAMRPGLDLQLGQLMQSNCCLLNSNHFQLDDLFWRLNRIFKGKALSKRIKSII